MTVELTSAQVAALAGIVEADSSVWVRQLAHDSEHESAGDVYVVRSGSATGVRVAPDGTTTDIGETLPAEG